MDLASNRAAAQKIAAAYHTVAKLDEAAKSAAFAVLNNVQANLTNGVKQVAALGGGNGAGGHANNNGSGASGDGSGSGPFGSPASRAGLPNVTASTKTSAGVTSHGSRTGTSVTSSGVNASGHNKSASAAANTNYHSLDALV